ncbi:MAG: endonuclease/exonuclease/phosphatase family protein [Casimicrobiaceae bacterium]
MHPLRCLAIAAATVLLGACVTVTREPRAVLLVEDQTTRVQRLDCADTPRAPHASARARLDPGRIRVATWNIHKQGDPGWESDLARLATDADLLLVQELVLRPDIRAVLERRSGMRWVMASSFLHRDLDIGVLTASRVPPVATCTLRVVEPVLRLPKSTVITWYAIEGTDRTLAVANMHAINFALSLGIYREQLAALLQALAGHDGPIVFAGDLNTWTEGRTTAVRETAVRLGLHEIAFTEDRRRLFFGKQLDHIFVRGLALTTSAATEVTSSDHNPVEATLRFLPPAPDGAVPPAGTPDRPTVHAP